MNSNWSYSPETTNFTSKLTIFVSYDLEIWRMTLKNNKVPLLCHTKLCASFHHYTWIQPGVKVRKRLNWVLTKGNNSWIHQSTVSIRQCNHLHIPIVKSDIAKGNIRFRGAVIQNQILSWLIFSYDQSSVKCVTVWISTFVCLFGLE